MTAVLTATDVSVTYTPARGVEVRAVRDVDLQLDEGEFVGIVGESGCGKSTLGYALTRTLQPPGHLSGGRIDFDGTDIAGLDGEKLRRQRSHGFALVLQSGMNALNPVRTIDQHMGDILRAHRTGGHRPSAAEIREAGAGYLARVSLDETVLDRYPHELSGGMRQRVAIALALALEPRLLVFDEPTTALDVLVQRAVMQTILDLQRSSGFTALLISHDLGVVLEVTDRVVVMYAGRVVQDRPSASMLQAGNHPYTDALLSCYADPRDEEVHLGGIPGTPPDLSVDPPGCAFAPRCPLAEDVCRSERPELTQVGDGRVACHVRAREAAATAVARG